MHVVWGFRSGPAARVYCVAGIAVLSSLSHPQIYPALLLTRDVRLSPPRTNGPPDSLPRPLPSVHTWIGIMLSRSSVPSARRPLGTTRPRTYTSGAVRLSRRSLPRCRAEIDIETIAAGAAALAGVAVGVGGMVRHNLSCLFIPCLLFGSSINNSCHSLHVNLTH